MDIKTPPKVGQKVTNFQFQATNNINSSLSSYLDKFLIFYFYPKDATSGCTLEGQEFAKSYNTFKSLNAEIFGISRDSLKSHERFKLQQNFPFELISDSNEGLCQLFDVIKLKSMYGKQYRGIERSTFIINPQGVLSHEWRKVTVKGHVEEVLAALQAIVKAC